MNGIPSTAIAKISKVLEVYLKRLIRAKLHLADRNYEGFEDFFRLSQAAIANLDHLLAQEKIHTISSLRNPHLEKLYVRIKKERKELELIIAEEGASLVRDLNETYKLRGKLRKFRSQSQYFSKFEYSV